MASPPPLQLFGVPAFGANAGRVVFTSERPFQLLCYLACRRQWVRRDELADILWPDHDAAQARSNLRKVLLLASRVPGIGGIERQGDRVRWLPDSDLARFEAACDERRFADAIDLATAPLLEGFEDIFVGAGASWLRAEQRRVAARWHAACLQRLDELVDQPAAAGRLARQMLARDAFDEFAVQALARAHLALDEGAVAVSEIEAYTRRLDDELGVEPSAALRALASAAQGTSRPMPLAASAARHDTAFIGRRAELRELTALLEQPRCRLLSLIGPGGIGKSSTAAMLAAQLAPGLVDAVVTAALADLTDVDQVPARLAVRLGATLSGAADPWAQIAAAIGDRSLALVLDNVEQLAIADRLAPLLDAAPRLRIVVTSRARLGLACETPFILEGLPLPDDDETDVEVLRRCDAVALFEARALAASRQFDLEAQAADVVRLVRGVEGLPLAIELAANWTRLLPAAEIADEIEGSLDLLESYGGAERSLRASFAQSWRLLSPAERDGLPRLALLPGDFGRDMAKEVAGTSLAVIAALVDKSLLRSDGSGRFSMHPLLRRCAAEHAAADDAGDADHAVMARLAAFIATWLGDFAGPQAPIPQTLMPAIERELAHVRAAWAWALARRDAGVIGSMARALSRFFEQHGMWDEGLSALARAVDALAEAGPSAARARVAAYRGLSILQYNAGALAAAEASARHVVALAESFVDGELFQMSALNTIGLSLWERGRFEEARASFERALQGALRQEESRAVTTFSSNIAMVDKALGRYAQALVSYERILAADRKDANLRSVATSLNNIGNIHRALGRPDLAIERLNEALVLCTQHSLLATRSAVVINLGLSHMELGHMALAKPWLDRALIESRQNGAPMIEMAALLTLAQLDVMAGEPRLARTKVWEALAVADPLQSMNARAQCVAAFGEILAAEGRLVDGVALMRWAVAQPTLSRPDRDITERRIAALLARDGGSAPERRDLPADTPIADLLALVAAGG